MRRVITWFAAGVVLVLAVAYAVWPRPLEVEATPCRTGTIETFITEEAETRLDDEYIIAMPIDGRLQRIADKVGTEVEKGQVVARVEVFERRQRLDQLAARVQEIEALIVGVDREKPKPADIRDAELAVEQATLRYEAAAKALDVTRIDFEQEAKQYDRWRRLLAEGSVSQSDYDEAQRRYLLLKTRYDEAELNHGVAAKLREQQQVRLQRLRDSVDDNEFRRTAYEAQIRQTTSEMAVLRDEIARAEVAAPVTGPILEKYQEDERVLAAGTPLFKIGDLASLRVAADILSEEVGAVSVGADVEIVGPAVGNHPIPGKVERIYPGGFEKISSLGIEQQRVKVIVAFDNAGPGLRPGVRVDVRILMARRENVLLVPERALFKEQGQWQVFVVRDGRARRVAVEIGLRNDESAQVTAGLQEGEVVVPSPPPELDDGVAVATLPVGR